MPVFGGWLYNLGGAQYKRANWPCYIIVSSLRVEILIFLFWFDGHSVANAWHPTEAHYVLLLSEGV